MKWFLIALVCVSCSAGLVRGDAAGALFQQGDDAMKAEDYAGAAKYFDQIITSYPNTPSIDDIRVRAGFAYFRAGDYPNAISHLVKVAAKDAKPEVRGPALLFTGMSYLGQAQKMPETDKSARFKVFVQAISTFTDLISFIKANPTDDNNAMMEDALYYRVLSAYQAEDYDSAIKDTQQLLTDFPSSLRRPDYYLLLGGFYATQASNALAAKKPADPADPIEALAKKALDAFDNVSRDPNALVQANDANLREAQVLFMIASIEGDPASYQKALDQFRLVHRKDDMIPLQQARLDALKAQAQSQVQNATAATITRFGLLIDREEGRLKDLQNAPDPIIQALISIAECYNSMRQGDEARTVLHRLAAIRSTLTPDQQQTIDFQLIYSYVLVGQSEKADAALTDYLAKHPGDQQAQGISYEMSADLLKLKDYKGALAQAERSLKDFPQGAYAADAISLKAEALRGLKRFDEAQQVIDEYVSANPTSPVANRMLLTKGQTDTAQGDLKDALVDFQKVKDNPSAGDLVPTATAAYIQTLQSLEQYDDVIKASQDFAAKYPTNDAMPSVLTLGAVAMDKKKDPGAVAALQNVAKNYPKSEAASYALYYVVNIYQRLGNIPAMVQAANDFRTAFPEAYSSLLQVADALSGVEVKAHKFDQAAGEYQSLIDCPMADVASAARNKIGAIWLQAAKAMGAYQSMQQQEVKDEAQKRLASAEQAYLGTLKSFPGQLSAVGDAFDGLNKCLLQRRSWGLLKDDGFEDYLGKITADLTSPDMQLRVELAKASLPFIEKNGVAKYQQAMNRFKQVVDAHPDLALTRQEASRYGELLVLAKAYPTALQIFNALLNQAAATDQQTLADAYYGLGSTYLAQGDLANAKANFTKMTALNGGAAWHPHIMDAQYGLALANEQSSDPADNAAAKATYSSLMQSPQANYELQAKAMIGYGRILEKAGNPTTPSTVGTIEFAVHYYQQVHLLFGPAVPELSAEGLYDAGQAFDKAGDKANAQKSYNDLLTNYATTAPDWAAKAKSALGQ